MTALYEVFGGNDAKAQDLNQYRNLFRGAAVYDVKNGFGAVGDGVTDDLAAFDACASACASAGGGIIFVPDGNYYLSDHWLLDMEMVHVECSPGATIWTNGATTSGSTIAAIGHYGEGTAVTPQRKWFSWHGGTIYNVNNSTLDNGIGVVRWENARVEGVRFTEVGRKAITAQYGVDNVFFRDNIIDANGAVAAISIESTCNNVHVDNNVIASATGYGIYVTTSVADVHVEGNVIYDSTDHAITFSGVSRGWLSDNSVHSVACGFYALNSTDLHLSGTRVTGTSVTSTTTDFGIALASCERVTVDGAHITGCYRSIMANQSSHISITNCTILDDHSDLGAIDISQSEYVIVSNCTIISPKTHGIDFRLDTRYATAVDCTVKNAGYSGFVISGGASAGQYADGCGFHGCVSVNAGTALSTFGCGFIVENGAKYCSVTGCISNVAEATGFLVGKGTGDRPAYISFAGCVARGSGGAGFWNNDAAYVTYDGCNASVFGTDGFKLTCTQTIIGASALSSCQANNGTSATGRAFYVSSSAEGVSITGCQVRNTTGYGIYIDAPRASVVGCTVMDADTGGTLTIGGIHLTANASRTIVSGCTSHRSSGTKQDYGIAIASGCTNAVVTSNVFYQNTTSGISDSGTTTVLANNVTT